MEYERLEPFGAWRDNYHAAMVASILANAHRDPRKKAIEPQEFFYRDAETVREQKDRELINWLDAKSNG